MAAISGRFVRHHNGGFTAIDLLACVAISFSAIGCSRAGLVTSRPRRAL